MSRPTTVAAVRLLLVSLPFSIVYPQMLPLFTLLNATAPPVPLSSGAPGEMMIYNYSDPVPTYNYSEPEPLPFEPGIDDDSGPEDFDPVPLFESYPEEPPTSSPMDPIYVDPMYPGPPMHDHGPEDFDPVPVFEPYLEEPPMSSPIDPFPPMQAPDAPTVSITTFLAVVQPLLDMIATLLPSGNDGDWYPTPAGLPFQMGSVQKRAVAADQICAVTEKSQPFFANLIKSLVVGIQSLFEPSSIGSAVNATDRALRARQMHTLGGIIGTTKPPPDMVQPVYGDAPASVPAKNIDRAQQRLNDLNSLLSKFTGSSSFGSLSTGSASSTLTQLRASLSSSSPERFPAPARVELTKRQMVGSTFIKNFIGEFHYMYPVLYVTDPQLAAGLGDIMSNPSLSLHPFESLDTSQLPDAMKVFIVHMYIFMFIMEDPSVPQDEKLSILEALADGLDLSPKRVMRGKRKRQTADPGPAMDDAYKMDNEVLEDEPTGSNGYPWWYTGTQGQEADAPDSASEAEGKGEAYYPPMGDNAIPAFENRPGTDHWAVYDDAPPMASWGTAASYASPTPAAQEHGCY
jgi:hypothetical protein